MKHLDLEESGGQPAHAFADGDLVPLAHEMSREDAGAFITRISARYNLNTATAMELITEVMEVFGAAAADRARPQLALKTSLLSLFSVLLAFKPDGAYWGIRKLLWVLDDPSVDDLIGHQSPADWWRATGKSKFMCYKSAEAVRLELKLPLREDQRKATTRARQSARRKANIQPRGK